MIGHYLKFDNITFQLISDLLNDFFQPNIYAVYKYLAAILWTKNNMVLAGVDNMSITFISLCAHNSYYTASRCIIQAKPRFSSPLLKQGGFSAHLVNVRYEEARYDSLLPTEAKEEHELVEINEQTGEVTIQISRIAHE